MTVVLEHTISFPLSLKSRNLLVRLNDQVIRSTSYEKINKKECLAQKGTSCLAKTIIVFHLPSKTNCTEYHISVDFDLATQCGGPNDKTSKFLCIGLRKSLTKKFVRVNLPIKYSLCPKIETTEVSVKSFDLTQNSDVLLNNEILARDQPLEGKIVLNVDRIFQGSVFTMAKISSIKLIEKVPQPKSFEIISFATLKNGELKDPTTIEISFTYPPSYQQITTNLQNWSQGFFIEVTVDVSFYSPEGLHKRSGADNQDADSVFHSSVRAMIPNNALPKYMKRDQVQASSPFINLNSADVQKSNEEHHLIKQKIRSDHLSDQLKIVQKNNQKMIYLTIASVGACVFVALVAILVVFAIKKKASATATIQIEK